MDPAESAQPFDLAHFEGQIREAARRHGLTEDERDELRQESAVLILERREEFEYTVWNVVLREARRIRRNRNGPKRRTCDIDELDEDDASLIFKGTDPATNVEFREIFGMLPPDLQAVCGQLMYESPCSAARSLNMSPKTLRRKMREIRERLAAFGYDQREDENDG